MQRVCGNSELLSRGGSEIITTDDDVAVRMVDEVAEDRTAGQQTGRPQLEVDGEAVAWWLWERGLPASEARHVFTPDVLHGLIDAGLIGVKDGMV